MCKMKWSNSDGGKEYGKYRSYGAMDEMIQLLPTLATEPRWLLIDEANMGRYLEGRTPVIKKVVFNNPATIVLWEDGTKTTVKCQGDEIFDKEKGLALCFMKKILGNKGNFNEVLKKWAGDSE
ncbi:hypothetical protein M2140_000028 [Clostridiales Family XIII bacterium PM5-7]